MIRLKSDRIIAGKQLVDGFVYIDGARIVSVSREERPADECRDFTGRYIAPGFIDIHTHGAGGYGFVNSSAEDVINGCNFHLRHGTTTIVPTISAAPFGVMRKAVENIAEAMKSGRVCSNIAGAHMEGPYLSQKQAGAQCPTFITPPEPEDYRSLIADYGDIIARWTYAPELDVNGEFCRFVTDHGIIASAGHTDAVYRDMATAIDNGCSLITHLYSCTSTVTRDHGFRSLGVIESAYLRDELFVEIIADGKHLPPELIKLIIKLKGEERVALVTDSLDIAGTDIREGIMSGTEFIVEDGVCKLKDRSAFAGSVATADRLLRVMVMECGFKVEDAVFMLTKVPAQILGLDKGELCENFDADIVVFDDEINVSDIFVGGKHV